MSDVPGEQPAQVPQPVVMKFGGTSLADAAAIRRAIRIVKPRLAHNPVVVASALADVTDQLLAAGQSAAKGQAASAAASLQYLQRRHEQVALDAAGSEAFESLRSQLASEFEQLHRLLPAISTFRRTDPPIAGPVHRGRRMPFQPDRASRVSARRG